MVLDLLADHPGEDRSEVDLRRLEELGSTPGQLHLLHDRARLAKSIGRRHRVAHDVIVDGEVTEGDREGDLPAADAAESRREAKLGAKGGDVARVGTGHDVLQQGAVGHRSGEGAFVAVMIEVERW